MLTQNDPVSREKDMSDDEWEEQLTKRKQEAERRMYEHDAMLEARKK